LTTHGWKSGKEHRIEIWFVELNDPINGEIGKTVGTNAYLRMGHIRPMYKWDYLVWKKGKLENDRKFEDANKIVILKEDKEIKLAAKIITYPGEPEQRFTFI
jgi:hypothetical protein